MHQQRLVYIVEKWIIIHNQIKKLSTYISTLSYIKAVKIEKENIAILIKISYLINHNFELSTFQFSKILVQFSLWISIEIDCCLKDEGDLLFIAFEKKRKKKWEKNYLNFRVKTPDEAYLGWNKLKYLTSIP